MFYVQHSEVQILVGWFFVLSSSQLVCDDDKSSLSVSCNSQEFISTF